MKNNNCIDNKSLPKEAKQNLNFDNKNSNEFKVKTLEEIRLEKIHSESPNYYETPLETDKIENFENMLDVDHTIATLKSATKTGSKLARNSDLRSRLKRRLSIEDSLTCSRKVSENKDFRIKTLEEIRREKAVKMSLEDDASEDSKNNNLEVSAAEKREEKRSHRKRILRRKPLIRLNKGDDLVENKAEDDGKHIISSDSTTNEEDTSNFSINSTDEALKTMQIPSENPENNGLQIKRMISEDDDDPVRKRTKFVEGIGIEGQESVATKSNDNVKLDDLSTTTESKLHRSRVSTTSNNMEEEEMDEFLLEADDSSVLSDDKEDFIEELEDLINS